MSTHHALVVALVFAILSPASFAGEPVSFNRDIRPILSDNCFQCHGPDEAKRKGGLRLDLRDAATKKLDSGDTAIVPGKPEASELLRRVAQSGHDSLMPPKSTGKKLSQSQFESLKRWIAEGAEYQGHWAFLPVVKPAPPTPRNPQGIRNPIDRFTVKRLEMEGLALLPEADKETLIRRVTLDLTGLPPTIQEVEAFRADQSPNAYEKVVDRLLKSSRYGEHMALQWLDFARYADSNGFQTDSSRYQWPWRDWVIESFNENQGFDQFTIEQIAGDLLPNATRRQIVATGFNRNHRLNGEGGLIAEEWRIETVIDRLETTGSTWLGLTFNCCRCHDHKFDPITQREFYKFYAFFNNVAESGTLQGDAKNTEPTIPVLTADREKEIARLDLEIGAAETKLAEALKNLPELQAAWEPGFKERIAKEKSGWQILAPQSVKSTARTPLTRQADGSYLAGGKNPAKDTYEIVAPIPKGAFSGLLLEAFTDLTMPAQSLGRNANGNFVLSAIDAVISAPTLDKPIPVKFAKAEADFSQDGWDVKFILATDKTKGWAVDGPTRKENRRAMVLVEQPIDVPANSTIRVRLIQETLPQHNIGRFRLSYTSAPVGAVRLNGAQIPETLKQALEIEPSMRSAKQQAELAAFYRANAEGPIKDAESHVAALKRQRADLLSKLSNVMVMKEMPQPREAFVLIRGQYDKKGDKVTAGLPVSLPAMPKGEPMNRLGLARWLVHESNPLTARVWVNRAWERFFGTGLSKTTENLGSQAEFPSHPELLDWLAAEFMKPTSLPPVAGEPAHAWDMKAIHKLMVMSATYRQSAHTTKELTERDPENRLLARGPRFRLPAEVLRDQALFVSGLLAEKIGGPSVRPYMPEGVWDETSRYGDLRGYKPDSGEGLHRRTMYTIWKRTAAPPSMLIFDAPSREYCAVKRSRTNTPLQALSLLNEITYVEAARKLGERMIKEGGKTPAERLLFGFRLLTARAPSEKEIKVLLEGLHADLEKYKRHPEAAKQLLGFGDAKADGGLDPAALAAYALTANVLLNLDEVITR
jgi:Protein of unknown function (DUF1553)/Protein of unknown function (DUF1549)/Planctomycete cytochrome C